MTVTLDRVVDVRERRPRVEAPASRRREIRRDIQGLRAVAVTLVVLYHAHVPGIRAGYVGVDVFFVISGFLITGQLVREVERDGRLRLGAFYARRMRRLLPAAMVVVLATLVAARLWGPVLQLRATATDAVWTALYALNFRLAGEGVDYQRANGPLSPLQHFWSLAVEEQFYLFWPLLVVVALLVARRHLRGTLVLVASVGLLASLGASAVLTQHSAPTAYFSVQTRAWEFAAGALVALGAERLARAPRWWRRPSTWLGLALVVGSAVVYDEGTAFPGIAAVVPVVGCALVVAGGCGPAFSGGAGALLDRRPLQAVGAVSYSWYLWHWPMLVLAPALLGYQLSWIRGLEVSALALWLAGLTYAVLERPSRRAPLRPRRWLVRGVALSTVTALAAMGTLAAGAAVVGRGREARHLQLAHATPGTLPAALGLAVRTHEVPLNLVPSLVRAADDVPVTQSGCHLNFLQTVDGPCVYGDASAAQTVVLFGDSHAQQWDGALAAEATAMHWRLVSWTKAACPVADVQLVNPTLKREYSECDAWREQTIGRIDALHPSLVIASQSDSVPGRAVANDTWAARTVETLRRLEAPGTRVVFLADIPYPKGDVPTCVAAHLADLGACEVSRAQAYHGTGIYLQRHQAVGRVLGSAGFSVIDPLDWMCSASTCPVIVGNTLVYRDDSHLTNTYSTELGPLFRPVLQPSSTGGSP